MNTEQVNELITSLESAGEISIKERKYLDLAKAYLVMAAENVGLKAAHPQPFGPEMMKALDAYEKQQDEVPETGMLDAFFILRDSIRLETPATDRIYAWVKASAIPEGFKLVPEQMYLSYEDIQAICMQCGNGDKKGYGDYEDGILWVGELSNDGDMKYGLNIANANYPEEGSITVFEFDEPLREGAK